MSLRNCKREWPGDITTCLLAWPHQMLLRTQQYKLIHSKWECKMVAACLEDGLAFSYNIKYILIYDSAVAFLDTYPNKLKAYS